MTTSLDPSGGTIEGNVWSEFVDIRDFPLGVIRMLRDDLASEPDKALSRWTVNVCGGVPVRYRLDVRTVTQLDQFPGAPLGHQPLRNNTKQPSTTSTQNRINTGPGPAKPMYSRPRLFLRHMCSK